MNKSAGRMGMKTFAGNRPTAEIIRNAKAQGVEVLDAHYKRGGDHIVFESRCPKLDGMHFARITYNAFNGRFFGTYAVINDMRAKVLQIDSSSTKHERHPWFQQLLSFFYVEKAKQ